MSSRRLQDMSSRRLEDVFSVTIFRLPGRLDDVLRKILKTSSRRLQEVFKTSSRRLGRRKIIAPKTCWRRLRDMSWRPLQHVWKTSKYLLGRVQNYFMQDHMVDLKRSRATSGEKNFIEHHGFNFLGGSFSNWDNVKIQVEFRKERPLWDLKT